MAHYSDEPPGHSPYALQLSQGFPWLRFEYSLEASFRAYYTARYLARARFVLSLAIILFAVFAFYNLAVLPAPVGGVAAAVQLAFICPWLLAAWGMSYFESVSRDVSMLAWFALSGTAIALMGLIWYSTHHQVEYPYTGLVLIVIAAYYLAGMTFWHALAFGLSCLGVFVLGSMAADSSPVELVGPALYLLTANIVGMLGAYTYEYNERSGYLSKEILEGRASRDGLTGIHNRRYLDEQIDRIWAQAKRDNVRVAAAFFDVDYFKSYNDVHGHLGGDDCLRKVAQLLSDKARRPLDVVVRYGGEEFLVIWYDVEPAEMLIELAEGVRRSIEHARIPHGASPVSDYVTVSAGAAACVPDATHTPAAFLEQADRLLYQAKSAGRNRVISLPHLSQTVTALGNAVNVAPEDFNREDVTEMEAEQPLSAEQRNRHAAYRRSKTGLYRLHYQFVFPTRNQRRLLAGEVAHGLRAAIRELCDRADIHILRGQICPDHIKLMLSVPPGLSPGAVIDTIRTRSAEALITEFGRTHRAIAKGEIWEEGYFVATIGTVKESTIERYVEHQDLKPRDDEFKITTG